MEADRLAEIRSRLSTIADPVALLEGIFAFAPVGFQIYDATGHCVLTNPAFRQLFGAEPPPTYNVLKDEIAERAGVLPLIHQAFAGKTAIIPTTWYDARDLEQVDVVAGRRVAIAATFFPLFDRDGKVAHVAIVYEDQTPAFLSKQSADADRERLSAILQQLPEGVLIAAPNGDVIFQNPAADRILGQSVLGKRPPEPDSQFRILRADASALPVDELPLSRALRGETVLGFELLLQSRRGAIPVLCNAAPRRDENGRVLEAIVIFQDISETKRSMDHIRRLNEQKDEFISVASHELRTPLTILKASAQAAERKLTAEAQGRQGASTALSYITKAVQQTDRMARLIEELLDVSRIESGKLELRTQQYDLRVLLDGLVAGVRPLLRDHRLAVDFGDQPVMALVDADRIEQVLMNLLTNAARYSPAEQPIELTLGTRDGFAAVTVRDKGVGISEGDLPHIFDRFYRGSHSDVRRFGGMGLGLFISAEIVRRHGGRTEVHSVVGEGSSFTVLLPMVT